MTQYMEGTGGGPGDAANYSIWQERDPVTLSAYPNQVAKLYLTPIYMWDKDSSYSLVKVKGPMPNHAAVQDGVTKTPAPKKKKTGAGEDDIIRTIKELSAQRAISTNEMMTAINGTQEKEKTTAEKINEIIDAIAKTRQQMGLCKDDLHRLVEKKRAIKVGPDGSDNNKERAKIAK